MYRCGICGHLSKPNQPRLTHVEYRQKLRGLETAREVAVCPRCSKSLQDSTLSAMERRQRGAVESRIRQEREARKNRKRAKLIAAGLAVQSDPPRGIVHPKAVVKEEPVELVDIVPLS
mgnify:CR=1 FL=1